MADLKAMAEDQLVKVVSELPWYLQLPFTVLQPLLGVVGVFKLVLGALPAATQTTVKPLLETLDDGSGASSSGKSLILFGLLAIGLALFGPSLLSSGASGAGDSIDGIAFPGTVGAQTFVGGGTRSKYGAVKVYAVGLYIDASRAASSLKPFVGAPASSLTGRADFFRVLQTGRFDRTLLLQFHRSVAADAVAGALRDSLASRLGAVALEKFRAALSAVLGAGSVAKGARLYFSCRGDALSIALGAPSPASTLKDKALCPAFLDVYLGPKPVSPAAKAGVATGFAARLYRS